LVRLSIVSYLKGERGWTAPEPPTETLQEEFGAFVTLKIQGRLRGCIGHLVGDKPIFMTVAEMARAAAFQDPRFPPLKLAEFDMLDIEISILSPLTPCPDSEQVEVGRHGLLIRKGGNSGLLLPQVATEWNWDRKTFLEHTCRKAGLPSNAWKEPGSQLFWFEAEVF
jgi:AmmeMemoRadiSam system protein A